MKRENHLYSIISSSLVFLLVRLTHDSSATTPPLTISSSCPSHCGNLAIPYPFGIGHKCYLSRWYEIICNKNISGKYVPSLPSINRDVVNISISAFGFETSTYSSYGSVRIKNPITSLGCSSDEEATSTLNMTGSPFVVGGENRLLAVGCNNKASMMDVRAEMAGCESTCSARNSQSGQNMSCVGYRCCESGIPRALDQQIINITIEDIGNNTGDGGCRVAFLTDETYSLSNLSEPKLFYEKGYAIIELDWLFDTSNLRFEDSWGCVNDSVNGSITIYRNNSCICNYGYLSKLSYRSCSCNTGYRGNPYIKGGCRDIDECVEGTKLFGHDNEPPCSSEATCVNTPGQYDCHYENKKTWPTILGFTLGFGLLIITIGTWWLQKFVRKRKKIIRRKKFFKRNGGLLLQHQLTVAEEGNVDRTKIFSSMEIEKATEKFSKDRILGQGGQGTVYKGMLTDGRIVAVKKSKLVDKDNLEEFINEVVILSQINHRNVVNLLGCCLETEVPILVYEFIPNGNLFEHLHRDQCDDYIMTWEVRLRVSVEIAGAVSYLHSAASIPVYHRDIKSTNILLDEKYRAKVSDFGTSRSVSIDITHLTTIVLGTAGYVDPEYLQSSQFTDKSDVYSFGVVLVELVTGEKPVSFLRPQECKTLATHFIRAMKKNKLYDIIDSRIKDNCELEEVMAVATLAKRCLSLKRKKRPNMREVLVELERIRTSPKNSKVQPQEEEEKEDKEDEAINKVNIADSWNIAITAPASKRALSSSMEIEPLVSHQTW